MFWEIILSRWWNWKKWTLWNGTKNKLLVLTFWQKPHNAIYAIRSGCMILLVCWEFGLREMYIGGVTAKWPSPRWAVKVENNTDLGPPL